jgi:hypothetical protein
MPNTRNRAARPNEPRAPRPSELAKRAARSGSSAKPQTTQALVDPTSGRIVATAADERLKNAQAAELEARAEATRLNTEEYRRILDREASRAPAPAGAGEASLSAGSVGGRTAHISPRADSPKSAGGGVLSVAIERVQSSIGAVQSARNRVYSRADYLVGCVPEAAEKDGTGPGVPSGGVNELHQLLSRLEAEIGALHGQIDRLDGL